MTDTPEASQLASGQTVAAPADLNTLLHQAQQAERAAAEFRAQAVALARAIEDSRTPQQPDTSAGPVYLAFTKYESGREYSYAAVGWTVGRQVRWTVTGGNGGRRHNWRSLLDFIGTSNWSSLHVLDLGKRIGPEPGQEPAASEDMGNFGMVAAVDRGTFPVVKGMRIGVAREPFAGPGLYGDGDDPYGPGRSGW